MPIGLNNNASINSNHYETFQILKDAEEQGIAAEVHFPSSLVMIKS